MVINGLVELAAVGVVPVYVRLITSPEVLTQNTQILSWYPVLQSWQVRDILVYGGVIMLLVYVIKLTFNILNGYFQERFIRGREMRISSELLKRYLFAPVSFHLMRNSSDLIRNAQVEIQTMNTGFIVPLLKVMAQLFIAPIILVALIWVDPLVSITAMVILSVAILLYNRLIRTQLLNFRDILQETRSGQLRAIQQALGAVKELKVLNREDFFLKRYQGVMNAKRIATIRTQMLTRINGPYLEFIALMGMLLVAILLTMSGASMEVLAATLAFYGVAMFRLKQSIGVILDGYTAIKVNHITIRPIYEDMQSLRVDVGYKKVEPIPFLESIVLENVSFRYPNTKKPSLQHIDLTIRKGESIGLVGRTGAGKTTLVDVILGLLKPEKGRVLVDGKDIFGGLPSWHGQIGYIPQQIYLLDDTIRANVAFGLPPDQINDKMVWTALEAAQIADFIRGLPEGVETITGERGIRLSGGQRQRIGIARALYHEPSVLIMDEATAALDNKTENSFVEALDDLRQDHTLIIIAHRLSTIKDCDRIIVMDKGRIIAIGNYLQLLESEQVFQELAQ